VHIADPLFYEDNKGVVFGDPEKMRDEVLRM
jgi:NAD/NADP transhydrogenase beta subunit